MSAPGPGRVSRRVFLAGSAGTALALGLSCLREEGEPGSRSGRVRRSAPVYSGDYRDLWRQKWTWDRVARGTHTRANCIAACSFDLFVRDGIVWREEQHAVYEAPRPDVPDGNPRGCQKGACYSDLALSRSRILHPLKRAGPRGSGAFRRISWEQALTEIADGILDAAVAGGCESVVYDHGTTNAGYGPETAGEMRFARAIGATILDSWSGVGDMPMGAVQTWGMYNCEGTSDDWFRSDFIVVWIGNPAYTRIPEIHFLHEARYRGARLVVVAPDLNPTAIHADLFVPVRPESDAALALSVAEVLVSEGLYDEPYVLEQTDLPLLVRDDDGRFLRESDLEPGGRDDVFLLWDRRRGRPAVVPGCQGHGGRSLRLGNLEPALSGSFRVRTSDGRELSVRTVFDRLRETLARYRPEEAGPITGVAPDLIRGFARELAGARRAMILASWGACKHYHSDLFQRAMILLMALTGNQGRSGGGLRVAAWWGLDGLDRLEGDGPRVTEILRVLPRALRGLTPRDYEELFTAHSAKSPYSPLMPFLYLHGGYREAWEREELADPALPRPLRSYFREALDRGWTRVYPREGNRPRVYLFTGCNPLRRWPAPQIARRHLWPRLDLVVAVNFRMSTSALHADYILPAAGYYEKHGIKYAQSYLPYVVVSDRAVPPPGEAKSEWEIFGLLAERVSGRARERAIGPVRGFDGSPVDLSRAFERYTSGGRYDPRDPEDPVRLMEDIFSRSPSVGRVGAREALERGAVRIVGTARPTPIYATYSDYDPGDTCWPHRSMVEQKRPWPTLTGRQQFYLDHPWYLEAGEALPVHKESPHARSPLPLRLNGGHTRWSVHAIWRDHELMQRLRRGAPVCFLSPVDCRPRGIRDGDRVRIRNHAGSTEAVAAVAPRVRPGEVILYHAFEPYQHPGGRGQQEPVEAPWKPIHLAGGYGQLHVRMFYGSPGHAPRGAPVEVERVGGGSS